MSFIRNIFLFCGIIIFVGYLFGKIKLNLNQVVEQEINTDQNLKIKTNVNKNLSNRKPASIDKNLTKKLAPDQTQISKSSFDKDFLQEESTLLNSAPFENKMMNENQEIIEGEKNRDVAGFAPQSTSDISNTETQLNTSPTKIGNENIYGTDTSDFTQVSSSNSSNIVEGGFANGGITPSDFNCTFDKAEGTYSKNIQVNIKCSENARINFCISTEDSTCDPLVSSSAYNSGINLIGNNSYYISYYGESIETGELTEIINLKYIIDSTPPNLVVNYPKIILQTSQLPFENHTYSTDFGKDNFYYHQINLKNHNPTSSGLGWSCSQIFYKYQTLVSPSPTIIQNNYSISSLGLNEKIDQKVDMARLEIGNNYMVTFIENRDAGTFSCQTQNIKINDFFISSFTGTGTTPIISGVKKTSGGFGAYGVFQRTPASISTGSQKNEQSEKVLQSSLVDILY